MDQAEQDHGDVISKDTITGLLLLALAAGYCWLATDIPSSSLSDEVGADGLPKLLAAALAVVAIFLLAKSILASYRARPAVEKNEEAYEHALLPRASGFVAIGVGYMVVAPVVGFAAGIAALIIAVALYERELFSWKLTAVAAAGGVGFWLVFVRFLGADQPASSLLAMLLKGWS